MTRRGFLGTALAGFAGALMIRSLGQTALAAPEFEYQGMRVGRWSGRELNVQSIPRNNDLYGTSHSQVDALKALYDDHYESVMDTIAGYDRRRRKRRWIGLFFRPSPKPQLAYPVCRSCKVVPLDTAFLRWNNECERCTIWWGVQVNRIRRQRRVTDAVERAWESNR